MFRVPADAVDMRVPREYVLPRGWQAFAIVALIPLWWLIGASFFMWPLIAFPLIAAMVVRGRILAPRRFGIWLLFILWVIASGVELSDPSRALAWGWRLSFYVAGAAVFLYLVNVPERRISTRAVVNAMAALWVMVVFGGWLGVAFPGMNFASPMEKLLPHGLSQNQYVYAHVHLEFAQIQHFLGFPIGRPETFFAYTNAWGSAFAMLAPCAICAMLQAESRAWKMLLRFAMAASIVPVVFSLNRGLWLSLGLALMSGPKLLMLDEPSLGLAPSVVRQIFDRVRHLADTEGLSVLLLEQNVAQALRIVDRVYVMRSGRVILEETVEQMRQRDSYWDLF